jgi:phosphoserine phosphatase
MPTEPATWNDTPRRRAIVEFVAAVTAEGGPDFVPVEERIAVFDNDGTLWCEHPGQVQGDFIVRRLAEMAAADPSLRSVEPWRAAAEGDGAWFADVVTRHYRGDSSLVPILAEGVVRAFGGLTVEEFESAAARFLRTARHPSLGVPYLDLTYTPMVELLAYLAAHGFTNYIVSGGGRDFLRPVAEELYGIPPERVIGSAVTLRFDGPTAGIVREAALDLLDDGPAKPVEIWGRIGRRPILAAGNANGDIPMLQYTEGNRHRTLCLLVRHDDPDREFAYRAGAEDALEAAGEHGWQVVSIRDDFAEVFAGTPAEPPGSG